MNILQNFMIVLYDLYFILRFRYSHTYSGDMSTGNSTFIYLFESE